MPMTTNGTRTSILDAGVLLALALGGPASTELAELIQRGDGTFACTEIGLCEFLYILCRRVSWRKAKRKIDLLLRSSAVRIIPMSAIWVESARIKCKVPIPLPDCHTIAAARLSKEVALFARRERETADAMNSGKLRDKVLFLEGMGHSQT